LRYSGFQEQHRKPTTHLRRDLINFLALQLHVPSSAWNEYAQRDETRREHLVELQTRYGFRSFTLGQYHSLATSLLSTALQTSHGIALVRAAIEELRRPLSNRSSAPSWERLCAETALRVQRQLFAFLTPNFAQFCEDFHCGEICKLLDISVASGQ
jgi:Domain of unknown function (DUF4158)